MGFARAMVLDQATTRGTTAPPENGARNGGKISEKIVARATCRDIFCPVAFTPRSAGPRKLWSPVPSAHMAAQLRARLGVRPAAQLATENCSRRAALRTSQWPGVDVLAFQKLLVELEEELGRDGKS